MSAKYHGYIVFDLELTCWDVRNQDYNVTEEEKYKQKNEMEIIDIGAVKTDYNFNIIDQFSSLVKPIINPILSDFCKRLTNITQEDVDSAPNFLSVYKKFKSWSEKYDNRRRLPTLYIGWGEGDGREIEDSCRRHGIGSCINQGNYINGKILSKLWLGHRAKGLKKEIERAELSFQGIQHRGLTDAINTAILLQTLKSRFES